MNQSHFARLAVSVSTGALALLLHPAAHAADNAAQAAKAPVETGEIVVTAEKRNSTVQKTPISMTALSGADIVARGAIDFDKLAQDVPGISERSSGPGQTEFELRGLSSGGGAAPTVGFYLDETPLTAASFTQNGKVVIDPNLYDISRVEVLRGPQGTLYGSGSMGGTIKLITNAPNLTRFEVSANASVSGTKGAEGANNAENLMVNLPLVPGQLALRVVGSLGHTAGWIDRVAVGQDNATDWNEPLGSNTRWNVLSETPNSVVHGTNADKTRSIRATLTWAPTSDLTITPMFMYQYGHQNGYSAYDSVPGPVGSTLAHYQPFDVAEPITDNFYLGSLVVKYHAAGFDLTSATAYWTRSENQFQDATENVALQILGGSPYVDQGGVGVSLFNENDKSRQFSEELRLASNGDGRFNWIVGGFYSAFRSDFDISEPTPGVVNIESGPTVADGTSFAFITEPTWIKQVAVFGEANYKITDNLKITAGLRWFDFHTHATSFQNGFLFDGSTLYNVAVPAANSNSGVNPKLNISWTPDPNLLIYGTISKGFRPSGVNQPVATSFGCPVSPLTFQQDSVWNYEAGEKAKLAGGRITFNSDVYYERWNNPQNLVYLVCGFTYTANSAPAEVYGGEAEMSVKLIPGDKARDGLTLTANAGYAHAQFVGDSPSTFIVNGDPLTNIPHWTVSGALTYATEIGKDTRIMARVNYNYTGSRQELTLFASPNGAQPGYQALSSYQLTDARIGVEHGAWSLSAFVNNVFNKQADLSYLNVLSYNAFAYNRVVTNQPRTIGVDFSIHY